MKKKAGVDQRQQLPILGQELNIYFGTKLDATDA